MSDCTWRFEQADVDVSADACSHLPPQEPVVRDSCGVDPGHKGAPGHERDAPGDRGDRDDRYYGSHDDQRRYPRYPRDAPRNEAEENPGNNLYVSSLSREAQDADLEALFQPFGALIKAQVMRDPHSREARGFGFVTYEHVKDAEAAIEALNGRELLGRAIVVQKARRGGARTPTPGQYLGPSKRGTRPRRGSRGGRWGDRGDRWGNRGDRWGDRGGYARGASPPPRARAYEDRAPSAA